MNEIINDKTIPKLINFKKVLRESLLSSGVEFIGFGLFMVDNVHKKVIRSIDDPFVRYRYGEGNTGRVFQKGVPCCSNKILEGDNDKDTFFELGDPGPWMAIPIRPNSNCNNVLGVVRLSRARGAEPFTEQEQIKCEEIIAGYYCVAYDIMLSEPMIQPQTILTVNNLSFSYGKMKIFENLSFDLKEGEILALIGPSGCGKTTLLNHLGNVLDPDEGFSSSGIIEFEGKKDLPRGSFGYMFQEDRLLPWKSLINNMLVVDEISHIQQKRRELAMQYLREVGLRGFHDYYPYRLSGGMKKRASLALTFFMNKKIILLDEPLASVDYSLKLELERFIYRHLTDFGKSAIIVTHEYDTAAALADRILVLGSKPMRIMFELEAGISKKYDDTFYARKSHEYFELYSKLLDQAGVK